MSTPLTAAASASAVTMPINSAAMAESTAIDFSPLWISLETASATIAIVFVLGVVAAWWVERLPSESAKIFIDGVFTLPMVLPPTVAGFFLLIIFGNNRLVGRFFIDNLGLEIAFSWLATVLAAAVIAFPLMYRSARGALAQVDKGIMEAGRSLGMTEWRIFWRLHLPNALPGIIAGGLLAFARGLGEFGATAMLAGNIAGKTRTLPLAVYSAVAAGDFDAAGIYVAIILVICFAVVIGLNYYQYKVKQQQEGSR